MRKTIIAVLAASGLAVALTTAAGASDGPRWLHIQPGPPHHGHPCVIVYGGGGDTSARVCKDGYAETS